MNNYIRNTRLRVALRCTILSQAQNHINIKNAIDKNQFPPNKKLSAKFDEEALQIWKNSHFLLEETFISRRQPRGSSKDDKEDYAYS